MRWPWVSYPDLRAVADRLGHEIMELQATVQETREAITSIRTQVEAWEKAVLLAQVMRPEPKPDIPPVETQLPENVLRALRARASPGSGLYEEMLLDAARQLDAGLDEDTVIQQQLAGARLKGW